MEVYPKSSWFLLLLGFVLIAATLQEPGNCPTPDQVSCTTGVKCNIDDDCDKDMICCSNSCYTKRCIPNTKGVQGTVQSDGPSESECRPYIEKALKELEIGEVAPVDTEKESSEDDISAEDIPTVEITDDSSHQDDEDDIGEGDEDDNDDDEKNSDETTESETIQKPEYESEEKVKEESDEIQEVDAPVVADHGDESSKEDESEEPTEDESEKSNEDEEIEDNVEDKYISEELSDIVSEEIEPKQEYQKTSAEIVKHLKQSSEVQSEVTSVKASDEEGNLPDEDETPDDNDDESLVLEDKDEDYEQDDSIEEQEDTSDDDEDDEKQSQEPKDDSGEEPGESKQTESSKETLDTEQLEEEEEDLESRETRNSEEHKSIVKSEEQKSEEKQDDESEETETTKEKLSERVHIDVHEKTKSQSTESVEELGRCPSSQKLACNIGNRCGEHKECSDSKICCPNKCYRKECVSAEAGSGGNDDQSDEKEETDLSSEIERDQDLKCPGSESIACASGDKCGRNNDCPIDKICCTNRCYRKQCVLPGAETSAELQDHESPDDESKEEPSEAEDISKCPEAQNVACGSGDKCGRNRDCVNGELCCTNKCYRKQCVPPREDSGESDETRLKQEVTSENEEEESEEISGESKCPSSDVIRCGSGDKCWRNKDCARDQMCCPNKCYRKQCIPKGESDATRKKHEDSADEEEDSEEITGESECPPSDAIRCGSGEKCGKDKDCGQGQICCPNKCYRKQCIPKDDDDVVSKEKLTVHEEKPKVEAKEEPRVVKPEVKIVEVKKIEIPRVVRQVKEKEPEKEEERSIESVVDVEDLGEDSDIPTNLRPRDHVEHLLKLDEESSEKETIVNAVSEIALKELKRLYENAIKPLEGLYKYRDLSNRHFGDAEIFSKPLILFMGPWSGGKSTIINYLINNEYNETSLRTGAEPSPAYFNILMHGEESEVIDGTQLAADFTFSGLQKFGQGLEERLRGVKLPAKLLEKVNIVEIPGILEVRKQVSRVFPFNDACQWFIDRADIIFLVYDPSKLDVGPETEAILDQLKGREHQTRIVLNKADQVKPEELLRVQGALIWNISPLMSSPQPPTMYTTSLWSKSYEPWAPKRLLHAQERAFLRDLRGAIEKRIENKIGSARRFAVRVRNHAKMVDCYLTTYYNHKSVFGNRKQVANEIIEHPQDYHIYEGLSTLTNISRYDLPDPEVYRDFFKLNPLYEFQQLSATCTYFRGCPINRLDIAIAYDLPELLGTYKRNVEEALTSGFIPNQQKTVPGS